MWIAIPITHSTMYKVLKAETTNNHNGIILPDAYQVILNEMMKIFDIDTMSNISCTYRNENCDCRMLIYKDFYLYEILLKSDIIWCAKINSAAPHTNKSFKVLWTQDIFTEIAKVK